MAVSYTAKGDSFIAGKPSPWSETRTFLFGTPSTWYLPPHGKQTYGRFNGGYHR